MWKTQNPRMQAVSLNLGIRKSYLFFSVSGYKVTSGGQIKALYQSHHPHRGKHLLEAPMTKARLGASKMLQTRILF